MWKTGSTSVVALLVLVGGVAAAERAASVFENSASPTPDCELDRIVFAKLSALDIQPVLCSDAVFVRRVYLDVIGTLPDADEARRFIEDRAKDKRSTLIDHLLERNEFAHYWAMRWGDILRIKAEFPVNLWPNAAQAYHRWVRSSLAENKPYDRFVREMLTSSGSNFRVGPVNFYRAIQNRTPEGISAAVALAFMGSRTDAWPQERLQGMAVFFSQIGYKPTSEWKEENVFWDPLNSVAVAGNVAPGRDAIRVSPPLAADAQEAKDAEGEDEQNAESEAGSPRVLTIRSEPLAAVFPDGTKMRLPPDRDPREVFADWLITPENPWFTQSIVNRVWAWLLGRGIVHEPDDIRDDNPPSNPELLAYLQKEMIAGGYDLKRFYRLILNSNTYQLSSVPRSENPEAEANFASYPLRRLDAEVVIDAINKITGTSDLYTSAIPEPFTYIPRDQPAIAIADGSITSSFLAMFGRSARATGMQNERNNRPVPAQALHMLNSSHIQAKLEQGPALRAIITSGAPPRAIVEELYLTILSRFPTDDEIQTVMDYGSFAVPAKRGRPNRLANAQKRGQWLDISWALINSTEFLYRH